MFTFLLGKNVRAQSETRPHFTPTVPVPGPPNRFTATRFLAIRPLATRLTSHPLLSWLSYFTVSVIGIVWLVTVAPLLE